MEKPFTQIEDAKLIQMYLEDKSLATMAGAMCRSRESVRSKLKRLRQAGKVVTRESQDGKDRATGIGSYTFTSDTESAEVTTITEEEIKTLDDLIRVCNIDENLWEVEKWTAGKSTAYRKDRQVEWEVVEGVVTHGNVNDTGKLLVKPVYSIRVWLKRKSLEIRNNLVVQDLIADIKSNVVKVPKITYPKQAGGMMYEICIFDAHIGKLTWKEESGVNSDLKSQTARVIRVLEGLLNHAKYYHIDRIVVPFGNDFFNTDSKFNATTAGTPQQEDTRWQKTYRAGRVLAMTIVEMCLQIAPVDLLVIGGNHDETRTFMLGDALEAVYENNPNVTVDNSAKKRKYYLYGNSLTGFTHGNEEKMGKLPSIMAMEVPELWAKAKFREWHTGDKHHKEDMVYNTFENNGVVIRKLRSLSPPDAWHYSKGFVGAQEASEAFLVDKEKGVVGQFTES